MSAKPCPHQVTWQAGLLGKVRHHSKTENHPEHRISRGQHCRDWNDSQIDLRLEVYLLWVPPAGPARLPVSPEIYFWFSGCNRIDQYNRRVIRQRGARSKFIDIAQPRVNGALRLFKMTLQPRIAILLGLEVGRLRYPIRVQHEARSRSQLYTLLAEWSVSDSERNPRRTFDEP